MRLSTSTNIMCFDWKHPYQVPFEHSVIAAQAAGYHYLDANFCGLCRRGRDICPLTEDNWEEHVENWQRLRDSLGVEFKQAHAYFSIDGPVTEDTFPGGDFGEEMMRRSVLAAERLGVEWMVAHPVNVLADGKLSVDASCRYNLAYFRRWHEFWHAHGIGMAIENMISTENHMSAWGDIDRLIALADELDAPDVGICLDTGHAWLTGYDPADCVRRIGSRLKCTHIADNHGEQKDEHVAPFMGTIDWAALIRALRETGYENDFSFEIQNLTGCYPKTIQPGMVRFTYELGRYLLSDQFMRDAAHWDAK
ncbi:MAG: sugar phosphate isomerase/epimerase [Clostridia bacterium]|nr:sugar phosphate isomerase/epimerase [Clostridia bacterium]